MGLGKGVRISTNVRLSLTIDGLKIENRRFLEDTFAKGQKKNTQKKELVQRKIEPKKKM